MSTVNLTVAQAVVKFLGGQYSESDGVETMLFAVTATRARKVCAEHQATQKLFL